MKNHDKAMLYLSFFLTKPAVIFPIGDMKTAFFKFCRGKFFRGERVSHKLLLFVITNFFYARKSRFFSSLPTHYRGAGGTGKSARQGVDLTNVPSLSAEQALYS
jgi:hypothetical protein